MWLHEDLIWYRVTHKAWDFSGDCVEFILSFLLLLVLCICKLVLFFGIPLKLALQYYYIKHIKSNSIFVMVVWLNSEHKDFIYKKWIVYLNVCNLVERGGSVCSGSGNRVQLKAAGGEKIRYLRSRSDSFTFSIEVNVLIPPYPPWFGCHAKFIIRLSKI